jgi:hypothetical protein
MVDPLLTREEVEELLGGVSSRTVRRLAERGLLTRVRLGHRTSRYTLESVLCLIDPETASRPSPTRDTLDPQTSEAREHHPELREAAVQAAANVEV